MKKSVAALLSSCALVLSLGLVGCGDTTSEGSSSGEAAQEVSSESTATDEAAPEEEAAEDAAAEYVEAGYIDANGYLTAKALVELDGAKLGQVAEAAGHQWVDDDYEWGKAGTYTSPTRAITEDEYASGEYNYGFSADEVASFAAGAKGTPTKWFISNFGTEYDSPDQLLADQQVTIVDQCEVEHRNYGREIWAIVQNSAGDQFLMEVVRYESSGAGMIELYTTDYIATQSHGIASAFNLGDYLLYDAHTIDQIWPILQSGEVS